MDGWCLRKKVDESDKEKFKQRLYELELLGDTKFAVWWIESRMRFRPKSRRELFYELKQKGIDNKVIEEAIVKVGHDDLDEVKKIVEKNEKKFVKFEGEEKKRKVWEYLGRKGFGWDVISKVEI